MTKRDLRKKYKALRASLSHEDCDTFSLAIANAVLQLPIWEYRYYHLFLPIAKQKEVDTDFILHILSGKDKDVIVSKSDFETHTLTHYLLTESTALAVNSYGIPEPVDGIEVPVQKIDVVFVPLLAFDVNGHRIGYGKGFYDRFLSACKPETIKIGLSFFSPEEAFEHIDATDIALDYCVTPKEVFRF